jgi:hypothetical protein
MPKVSSDDLFPSSFLPSAFSILSFLYQWR